jgi:muramidase (phage lysozyme)
MATSKQFLQNMLLNKNVQAAIATIRQTEGTDSPEGFYYQFGSTPHNNIRSANLDTHPNVHQVHNGINSTAAGIGQWLYGTYQGLCAKYNISGFDEATQMLLFVASFDDLNVLTSISKGLFLSEAVMTKVSGYWASLPYNNYKQNPKTIETVRAIYLAAGGGFAAV